MIRWKQESLKWRGFPRGALALLARAQRSEVFRRPGDMVAEQTHLHPTRRLAVDLDVEEHLGGDGLVSGLGEIALEEELPGVVHVLLLEEDEEVVVLLLPVAPVEVHDAREIALERGSVETGDGDA